MPWNEQQKQRILLERNSLQEIFPDAVSWIDKGGETKVEIAMTSNSNKDYKVRVYLQPDFPNSCPHLAIVSPNGLLKGNGEPIGVDSRFHTLGLTDDGYRKICHFSPYHWNPKTKLYEVFMKGRLWIEAYEGHLATGKPIHVFLTHQTTAIDDKWEIDAELVSVGDQIGRGRYGKICKGEFKDVGPVAIFVLPEEDFDKKEEFFDMAAPWMQTRVHPNLVKLHGVCSQGPFYIIHEYMEGDLMKNLHLQTKPTVLEMISVALQICKGLHFLESQNLVHCNLTAANVLISGDWKAKLSGLWLCFPMENGVYMNKNMSDNTLRTAPESFATGKFTPKANVWSFGVLLSELITYGNSPYGRFRESYSTYEYHLPKPENIPQKLYELMLACMKEDPRDRPAFVEIEKKLTQLENDERRKEVDNIIYNDAYHRALEDGKAVTTRIPLMIVGQDRSGKTSLAKHLQGIPFDPDEPSTCGIEVVVVELNDANAEDAWKKREPGHFILTEGEATEQILKQAALMKFRQPTEPGQPEEETAAVHQNSPQGPELRASEEAPGLEVEGGEDLPSEQLVQEFISKDMVESIKQLEVSSNTDEDPTVTALVHDLAGQNVYFDTHFCFLKLQCAYIVVYDVRMPFESPAQPRFKPKNLDVERNLNNPLLATNLDFFLSWLAVLNKLKEAADHMSGEESPTLKFPPVLIALTNCDRFEGDVNEVKQKIKNILIEKGFENVFIEPYMIDNSSTNITQDEIRKLRKKSYELSKLMVEKQRPVPISWLQFESEMSNKMVAEKLSYISVEEARKIGKSCKVQDVDAAITFLHHQGVLVYHSGSSLVVLNPVYLMNLFAKIITVPQEDIPSEANYRRLMTEGILMEEYLRKIEHWEVLEDWMLRFGLICRWKYGGHPAFLVPSVAPVMERGKDVEEQLSTSPIAPLFFQFKHGYVLPGIFTKILVMTIKKCGEFLRSKRPGFYCNYTLLSFQHSGHKFDVYLIQGLAAIKIGVVPRGRVSHNCCVKFALYMKEVMTECFEAIKEDEVLFYRSIDYFLSVKCSVCPGERVACVRHGEKSCNNDACGHFWPIEELQELTEDPICDPASVVKTVEFPLERIKPWLGLGLVDDQTDRATLAPSINDLPLLKRQNICRLLDVGRPTGDDFHALAGHFGMCLNDFNLLSQKPNPTHEILTWASKNPSNTLAKLKEILSKMGRRDCIEIIEEQEKFRRIDSCVKRQPAL